jgi:hypothetical protein
VLCLLRLHQGASQVLRLSTVFPYKVLSLSTEPEALWFALRKQDVATGVKSEAISFMKKSSRQLRKLLVAWTKWKGDSILPHHMLHHMLLQYMTHDMQPH